MSMQIHVTYTFRYNIRHDHHAVCVLLIKLCITFLDLPIHFQPLTDATRVSLLSESYGAHVTAMAI